MLLPAGNIQYLYSSRSWLICSNGFAMLSKQCLRYFLHTLLIWRRPGANAKISWLLKRLYIGNSVGCKSIQQLASLKISAAQPARDIKQWRTSAWRLVWVPPDVYQMCVDVFIFTISASYMASSIATTSLYKRSQRSTHSKIIWGFCVECYIY